MYVVKVAVLMVITGGVARVDSAGTRTRGESHLLLVGDPGTGWFDSASQFSHFVSDHLLTGKSQFLKYAAKLVPRSVITTGIGSTSAGLTVTAVKDEGNYSAYGKG